jgi:hypothetical protein
MKIVGHTEKTKMLVKFEISHLKNFAIYPTKNGLNKLGIATLFVSPSDQRFPPFYLIEYCFGRFEIKNGVIVVFSTFSQRLLRSDDR